MSRTVRVIVERGDRRPDAHTLHWRDDNLPLPGDRIEHDDQLWIVRHRRWELAGGLTIIVDEFPHTSAP